MLVRRVPRELTGHYPFTFEGIGVPLEKTTSRAADEAVEMYALFVGISVARFRQAGLVHVPGFGQLFPSSPQGVYVHIPVQFSPVDCPHAYIRGWPRSAFREFGDPDGVVFEFRLRRNLTGSCVPDWQPIRARTDRAEETAAGNYFGNDWRFAMSIWNSHINPLTLDELTAVGEQRTAYFRAEHDDTTRPLRAFVSFVKERLIRDSRSGNRQRVEGGRSGTAVDLASGRGQDADRYVRAGFDTVVFVERDAQALSELVARVDAIRARKAMRVAVSAQDLSQPPAVSVDGIRDALYGCCGHRGGVDAVVCNLALHYFTVDKATLDRFLDVVHALLADGGTFTFTTFSGERIAALLHGAPAGRWSYRPTPDAPERYALVRVYDPSATAAGIPPGLPIDVLLPFSNGELYREYLVGVRYITDRLRDVGYVLELSQGFDTFYDGFAAANPVAAAMDAGDRAYAALFHAFRFRKETAKKAGGRGRRVP
jgi:SAM-dependent methyltransferase